MSENQVDVQKVGKSYEPEIIISGNLIGLKLGSFFTILYDSESESEKVLFTKCSSQYCYTENLGNLSKNTKFCVKFDLWNHEYSDQITDDDIYKIAQAFVRKFPEKKVSINEITITFKGGKICIERS